MKYVKSKTIVSRAFKELKKSERDLFKMDRCPRTKIRRIFQNKITTVEECYNTTSHTVNEITHEARQKSVRK